jgi:hypothetical protein
VKPSEAAKAVGKPVSPKPSPSKRAAEKAAGQAAKPDRFRPKRIALYGAIGTTVWTVVATLAKLPEAAGAGAIGGLGIVGAWELIKSDIEDRKKDK